MDCVTASEQGYIKTDAVSAGVAVSFKHSYTAPCIAYVKIAAVLKACRNTAVYNAVLDFVQYAVKISFKGFF